MSGGLAPSRSTAYISNLPFSLTNNDLHKIFEKYGKIVKVTVMKDKHSHKSRGVAFILFLHREDAIKCVQSLNNQQLFNRTIKANIAKDNGRSKDYIRRKEYPDKTRCYECGQYGHLSYKCESNVLGDRSLPKKKPKVKRKDKIKKEEEIEDEEDEDMEDPQLESLSAAIKYEQEKYESINLTSKQEARTTKVKKIVKDDYFSDEEIVE